jgi:hypothetical protein
VRHERSLKDGHYVPQTNEDRFTDYFGASEAIVTSSANGDSGLFETQLRDERFLHVSDGVNTPSGVGCKARGLNACN